MKITSRTDLLELITNKELSKVVNLLNAGIDINDYLKNDCTLLQEAAIQAYRAHLDEIDRRNNNSALYPEYNLDWTYEEFESEPVVKLIEALIKRDVDFAKIVADGRSAMTMLKGMSSGLLKHLETVFGKERVQSMLIQPIVIPPPPPATVAEAIAEMNWVRAAELIKQGADISEYLRDDVTFLQQAAVQSYVKYLDDIDQHNVYAVEYPEYDLDWEYEKFASVPAVDFILCLFEKGIDFSRQIEPNKSAMDKLKQTSDKLYNFLALTFGAEIIHSQLTQASNASALRQKYRA